MQTTLYNPIFINPQAYYIFPQLYDIHPKKDDFVEEAIFAGTLTVQDLSDKNNKLTFKDTRQIDLSAMAGKTVEISQYTELGSTVLGRWKINKSKDTCVLPEGYYYPIDFRDYFDAPGTYLCKLVYAENQYLNFDIGKDISIDRTWTIPGFTIEVTNEPGVDMYYSIGYLTMYDKQDYIQITEPGIYEIPPYTFTNPLPEGDTTEYICVLEMESYGDDTVVVKQIPQKLPDTDSYLTLEENGQGGVTGPYLLLETENKIVLE